jgi:hypothetical protein
MQGNFSGRFFDGYQFHRRLADGIGPESGSGCKDAHPPVAPQPRGANSGFPFFSQTSMEYEKDPNVGKKFKMSKGLMILIGPMDFKDRRGVGGQARLPRNAEFFRKAGTDGADGPKCKAGHGTFQRVYGLWFKVYG